MWNIYHVIFSNINYISAYGLVLFLVWSFEMNISLSMLLEENVWCWHWKRKEKKNKIWSEPSSPLLWPTAGFRQDFHLKSDLKSHVNPFVWASSTRNIRTESCEDKKYAFIHPYINPLFSAVPTAGISAVIHRVWENCPGKTLNCSIWKDWDLCPKSIRKKTEIEPDCACCWTHRGGTDEWG